MRFHANFVEDPSEPKPDGSLRVACFSDTHGLHSKVDTSSFESCDLIIFAGDLTLFGSPEHAYSFKEWFGKIECPNKLLIPGNLDLAFDTNNLEKFKERLQKFNVPMNLPLDDVKSKFLEDKDFVYAEHELVEICGLKIFASAYTPEFMDFAFQFKTKEESEQLWSQVPEGIDLLVTHGPPSQICDQAASGDHCGCPEINQAIERTQPAACIFGHIHEAHGHAMLNDTLCCNVSSVNAQRQIEHKPTIIDLIPN